MPPALVVELFNELLVAELPLRMPFTRLLTLVDVDPLATLSPTSLPDVFPTSLRAEVLFPESSGAVTSLPESSAESFPEPIASPDATSPTLTDGEITTGVHVLVLPPETLPPVSPVLTSRSASSWLLVTVEVFFVVLESACVLMDVVLSDCEPSDEVRLVEAMAGAANTAASAAAAARAVASPKAVFLLKLFV